MIFVTEIDTMQTEKIETEMRDVIGYESIQMYSPLSRVSFWACHSHSITYYSPPADRPPSRK
jgi:hypothetical protein